MHTFSNGVEYAQEIRLDHAQWCAPIESPNTHPATAQWDSPEYDYYRQVALAGGAICTDAPPMFFFGQSQNYRDFLYDQITWAKENGLVVVVIVSPYLVDDYYAAAEAYRDDLIAHGCTPDVWVVELYGNGHEDVDGQRHWIGNEDDPQTQLGVATHGFLWPYP